MINKLPKIELHCHLDGSVRVDTIIDIAKKENIKLESYEKCDVEKLVQVPNDCTSLNEYLKNSTLSRNDKYLFTRIVYGTVQNMIYL